MSRWSGLPASLDQRMRQLVVQLRRLKDHTGLSLAALAARTPYSKSSWERYLNGKKLPPRDAVEALCRLAGEPVGRLVALWELADAAWSGRGRSGAAQARGGRSAADDGPERATAPGTAVVAAAGPPRTAKPRRGRLGDWRAWRAWRPVPGPAGWRSPRRWPSGRQRARVAW
ncbi:helix-turn-helix transcriptional regulator [Streptomyces sp. P9-2B-2]|uniref:helix-turn-helix domain-containing protein n=1 Tax=Streptomyces sp. P9-2B-2 TaxID=3057114 RepID=UPI0025B3110B|nr:helix-turn-helix transcriptional regulator [Streptomyces sp. P9-2B-2]WJY40225.1 helix-turn-helix transcriptional regulator [Streptomyces sp. P9-2B-2]